MDYLALAKEVAASLRPAAEVIQDDAQAPGVPPSGLTFAPSPGRLGTSELALSRLLGMTLETFAREGALLEVRVPWDLRTLWFVPSEKQAQLLAAEGVSRGRVWTARELADLLGTPEVTAEHARTIALAKLEFQGEVVAVLSRPNAQATPAGPSMTPSVESGRPDRRAG